MKKLFATLVLFATIFALSGVSTFANEIIVKSGITVPIIVSNNVTSKNYSSGMQIEAKIAEDIKVNNIVVFKAGDKAFLNISHSKKAGFVGIPGELEINGGDVYDLNGEKHLVQFSRNYVGEEKTWPKVCLGCGLLIVLAPIALFGFVKGGGQAKVPASSKIDISLLQDFSFETL